MCNWCISFSMHTLSCQGQRYAGLLIAVTCKGLVIKFSKGMEPKKILGKEGWYEKIPHQGQGSWISASFISASYTHASGSSSRIIYICIVDTCIMHISIGIKDNRYLHHTYMHQGQGSRVIDTCNMHICASYTPAS